MGRKTLLFLLTIALIICALTPFPAFAWSDPDDISQDLIVEDNETSISGNVSIVLGKEKDLSGYIRYGAGNEDAGNYWYLTGAVRWVSSNPDIVSVSEKGMAAAHRVGTAVVTATGWDNTGRKHVQTIVAGVSRGSGGTVENSFELSEGTWLNLQQLGELHSGSKAIQWASSVPEIASVDSDGLVEANSIGRCMITASYVDEDDTEQTVKYRIRVTFLNLNSQTNNIVTLKTGDEVDLGALYYPNYQGLSRALERFSCTIGNQDVLSVNRLSIVSKSAGTASVLIREAEGTDETIRHKLTVYVTE